MVDNFWKGNIVPILARNVGVWKGKSNTLSILDITIISHVHSEKKKESLEQAFNTQIRMLGYANEVAGVLRIQNFNGTLLIRKCSSCKSSNLNLLANCAFCFSCGKRMQFIEEVKLLGDIQSQKGVIDVILSGDAADKILQFEKPLLQMCKIEQGLTRLLLFEVETQGVFVLDPNGQVIGFHA